MKKHLVVFTALMALTACSSGEKKTETAPAQAPESFRVKLETSKGPVVIEVTRAWAPHGADHFYDLVQHKFYDEARFFRVVKGFVVQFGVNKDPAVGARWASAIQDDPVRQSNTPGMVVYAATQSPNSRNTQIFINTGNNSQSLDPQGFAPFGKVVAGLDHVYDFYDGYGETPDQTTIQSTGNAYLEANFPRLDFIKTARIE
jgi:peptidyl-prolyl cis-trans isomerase A (cyclophilin A)